MFLKTEHACTKPLADLGKVQVPTQRAVQIASNSGFHSLSSAAGVLNSNVLVGTVIFLVFRHKMELRDLGTIAF